MFSALRIDNEKQLIFVHKFHALLSFRFISGVTKHSLKFHLRLFSPKNS